MKILPTIVGLLLLAILCSGVWVLRYRPEWLDRTEQPADDDEDIDPQKLEIPVHGAKVITATLHRYVEAIGVVEPAPARGDQMAGTAEVSSPVPGTIAQILCQAGQQVKKGDVLVQLDDRVAVATEQQAAAALAEAKATQDQLAASPRPEQLDIARSKVEQAKQAIEFAQRNYARQTELAKSDGTSEKNVEQARLDMTAAQNELAQAQNELILLKPTPEELAAGNAKLAAAEAALVAAKTQREMLRIISPIDATVIAVTGNPGEFVDTSKVLIDLVSPDRLAVNVSVPSQEVTSLTTGMSAQLVSPTAGDEPNTIDGKIRFVGIEADRKTGSIPISIDLPAGSKVKSGETIHVRMTAEEHKDCLAVPKDSIVADENGDLFIALLEGDQATHKTVRVGLREGSLVELIADGLKAGDPIVGSGAYGLAKFQVAKVKVLEK